MEIPVIKIKRGLDIPFSAGGSRIVEGNVIHSAALLFGEDIGIKPELKVAEGDEVRVGDLIATDRARPGVRWVAPVTGKVKTILRGERRKLLSIEFECSENEDPCEIDVLKSKKTEELSADDVRSLMLDTGLWTELRKRPYDEIPRADAAPCHLFVNAMDTQPGAPDPTIIMETSPEAFLTGLLALSTLVGNEHRVILCVAEKNTKKWEKSLNLKVKEKGLTNIQNLYLRAFEGPHPAGLVGTHIHFLCPASEKRPVWHLSYATVLALGQTLRTGCLCTERFVSLCGSGVSEPVIFRTRLGAGIRELLAGHAETDGCRVIAGSVLDGQNVGPDGFLGRFVHQISLLKEDHSRPFLGWLAPGLRRFSILGVYPGKWLHKAEEFTSSAHGSKRAVMPMGTFEKVMPLDILPSHLMRLLVVGDVENSVKLGALELSEEDLALCTFVCSGKNDYGKALREVLEKHRKNSSDEEK